MPTNLDGPWDNDPDVVDAAPWDKDPLVQQPDTTVRTRRMTFLPFEVTTSPDANGDGSREWDWQFAVPGAVKDAYEGARDAFTAPGRAYNGELQVMGPDGNVSPEAIREGVNFATTFSPASAASRIGGPDIRTLAEAAQTTPAALRSVATKVSQDRLDGEAMRRGLAELGPEGVIADLGPNLTGQAGAIASTPGRGKQVIADALLRRHEGANARVRAAVEGNLGPYAVPSQVERRIKDQYLDVDPLYDDALRGAAPTNIEGVAGFIDKQIPVVRGDAQRALTKTRGMLNEYGKDTLDTDPGTLLQTRKAIDGMLEGETDGNVRGRLTEIRAQIDQQLADAVPGIKKADARFQELKRQEEALKSGQNVFGEGKTTPPPVDVRDQFEAYARPAGQFVGPSSAALRMREGARAEIERILGTNSNDVVKLNRFLKEDGDWNREKLATLFGDEKAGQLFNVLDAELRFANNRNEILFNSKTTPRQEALKELRGGGDGMSVKDVLYSGGFSGLARKAAGDAAMKVSQKWSDLNSQQRMAAIAELLMDRRMSTADAIAKAARPQPTRSIGRDAIIRALILQQTGGQ